MTEPTLEELVKVLIDETRENRRWLRFLAWDDVKDTIADTLEEDWEYHLYEDLDGSTTIRSLSERLPRGKDAVSARLNKWQLVGITEQTTGGQYDKLISLEVLNIDIPELPEDEE